MHIVYSKMAIFSQKVGILQVLSLKWIFSSQKRLFYIQKPLPYEKMVNLQVLDSCIIEVDFCSLKLHASAAL